MSLNLILQMSALNFKHQLQILDYTSFALNLWLTTLKNYFQAQKKNLPQTHRDGRTESLLELLIVANYTQEQESFFSAS